MNPTELFEDWLTERENDYYDPLSREAALPYAFIWKKWIDWLGSASPSRTQSGRPPHFLKATQEDALAFLTYGPSPSSKRNGTTSARRISPVTRLRYGVIVLFVQIDTVSPRSPIRRGLPDRRPTRRMSNSARRRRRCRVGGHSRTRRPCPPMPIDSSAWKTCPAA